MELVNKFETTVAKWYEKAPHLPVAGRTWLAENVWWLALVGVVLMAFAILGLLSLVFFSGALLVGFAGPIGAVVGGLIWLAGLITLGFLLVQIVLTSLAVTPLKNMRKKGWTLLFIVALLNVAAEALAFLFQWNIFQLFWGVAMAAVGAYFLFEIRSYFVTTAGKKVVSAKVVTKKA